jgi:hypothetical protein
VRKLDPTRMYQLGSGFFSGALINTLIKKECEDEQVRKPEDVIAEWREAGDLYSTTIGRTEEWERAWHATVALLELLISERAKK